MSVWEKNEKEIALHKEIEFEVLIISRKVFCFTLKCLFVAISLRNQNRRMNFFLRGKNYIVFGFGSILLQELFGGRIFFQSGANYYNRGFIAC